MRMRYRPTANARYPHKSEPVDWHQNDFKNQGNRMVFKKVDAKGLALRSSESIYVGRHGVDFLGVPQQHRY